MRSTFIFQKTFTSFRKSFFENASNYFDFDFALGGRRLQGGGGGGGGAAVDLTEWNRVGDWNDVYLGAGVTMRFKPDRFESTKDHHQV